MTSLQRSNEAHRRRKKPAPPPKAGLAEPLGPPPAEYLDRCAVCRTALLVNEGSIDAGMGRAKVRKAYYQGFMPTIGCPGWSCETMAYVEQEA
jgi:hypothetical protein